MACYAGDGWVYVLKLEQGNWYAGYSENLSHRTRQHFLGNGSAWTSLHKPWKRVAVWRKKNKQFERRVTLELMKMFGAEKVRGAGWSATDHAPRVNERLQHLQVRYCAHLY